MTQDALILMSTVPGELEAHGFVVERPAPTIWPARGDMLVEVTEQEPESVALPEGEASFVEKFSGVVAGVYIARVEFVSDEGHAELVSNPVTVS